MKDTHDYSAMLSKVKQVACEAKHNVATKAYIHNKNVCVVLI